MSTIHYDPSHLLREEADALNRASGEVYTRVAVTHWRAYRHSDHWLSQFGAMKLSDWQANQRGEDRLLHAHSVDAAQEGFYKAIKTARTNRYQSKVQGARFPYKRKYYRTTVWKKAGIRLKGGRMLLSRAAGLDPLALNYQPKGTILEVRLVYDLKQHAYFWHIVEEDGIVPVSVINGSAAAIDMGEIHPVAITDGDEVCILSCRQLRSTAHETNRQLAGLQKKISRCEKGSVRSRKLRSAKRHMLARQKRRQRDLIHKISRATINWCQEHNVGTLAIGDVRTVADKTRVEHRLGRKSRQKISNWPHGMLRQYLGYKAEEAGISIEDKVPEHYTSQTCLKCGHKYKPKGRTYKCTNQECDFTLARDGVGCSNILSKFLYGEVGKVQPTGGGGGCTYRHPALLGKRSQADTLHVAIQEAPALLCAGANA